MSQIEYRIVKETFRNGDENFKIERKVWPSQNWLLISERDTLAYARAVVDTLRSKELVKTEVVE